LRTHDAGAACHTTSVALEIIALTNIVIAIYSLVNKLARTGQMGETSQRGGDEK
jgi:hypothetical protein